MLKLNHKKLIVWNKALSFINESYRLTQKLPKDEQYVLTSQIRRASVSIASNIAEGASRRSQLEHKRFYEISRSSLVEVDTQVEICLLLNYLKENELQVLGPLANEIFALLTTMINTTK